MKIALSIAVGAIILTSVPGLFAQKPQVVQPAIVEQAMAVPPIPMGTVMAAPIEKQVAPPMVVGKPARVLGEDPKKPVMQMPRHSPVHKIDVIQYPRLS